MANKTPLPAPAEDPAQMGISPEQMIAQAVKNVVGGEGGESPPASPAPEAPAIPSAGDSPEDPGSEPEPVSGESDAPEQAETPESGDSPPIELDGKTYTAAELQAIVEANVNREAFTKAAQERADKISQQVETLEKAQVQVASDQAAVAQEKANNEVYANYIQWLNDGNSGDIREFTKQTGMGAAPAQQAQAQPADDLDARIARVVEKTLGNQQKTNHQQTIQQGIDDWVSAAVATEPALKGREAAYQSDILHKLVIATGEQNLTPFDFPEAQIKNFLRQYAREAAQNESKLGETTLADRLDKAARTKDKLPATPRTQGTPLPAQPTGFKMDLKQMAQDVPDTDTYFKKLSEGLKEQADELSSMANNLG